MADPATAVQSLGYSPLELLPDELLLQIIAYLPTSALKVAVAVCKRIQPIVEESLYENVNLTSFPIFGAQPSHSIPGFLRTLLARPDLAARIKGFTMWVEQDSILRQQVNMFHGQFLPGSQSNAVTYSTTEFARQILWNLPALQKLHLDIPDSWFDSLIEGASPQAPDFDLVPAFRHLRTLVWGGCYLPLGIASIPKLEHLALPKIRLLHPTLHQGISLITSLSLTAGTNILFLPSDPHSPGTFIRYFDLIRRCSFLKKLVIALIDAPWPFSVYEVFLTESREGKLDVLVEFLSEVVPALEILEIVLAKEKNNWWLDHVRPVTSLKTLPKLKSIMMPQQCLTGGDQPNTLIDTTSIAELLPDSLERLEILYPSKHLFEFFDRLVQERQHCPGLNEVIVHCADYGRGLPYRRLEDGGMRKLWKDELVDKQFREAGMTVELRRDRPYSIYEDPEFDRNWKLW